VLYFLGFPNQGLTARSTINPDDIDTAATSVDAKTQDSKVMNLGFQELQRAAYTLPTRKFYEGQTVMIKGEFVPNQNSDRVFSLARTKITCCAADAITLNVVIVSPEPLDIKKLQGRDHWVEVTGAVQFRKKRDRDEYVTVMQIRSPADLKIVPPGDYLQ